MRGRLPGRRNPPRTGSCMLACVFSSSAPCGGALGSVALRHSNELLLSNYNLSLACGALDAGKKAEPHNLGTAVGARPGDCGSLQSSLFHQGRPLKQSPFFPMPRSSTQGCSDPDHRRSRRKPPKRDASRTPDFLPTPSRRFSTEARPPSPPAR